MIQAHVFISGYVQGIGFRHFVRKNARNLELTGWVRNLPAGRRDNRVEASFQGSKEKIEEMIELCKKGPFLSDVKDVDVKWEKASEVYSSFEIIV